MPLFVSVFVPPLLSNTPLLPAPPVTVAPAPTVASILPLPLLVARTPRKFPEIVLPAATLTVTLPALAPLKIRAWMASFTPVTVPPDVTFTSPLPFCQAMMVMPPETELPAAVVMLTTPEPPVFSA